MTPRSKSTLRTAFVRSGERRFSGFAVDTGNLTQRFAVEILVDGCPVKVVRSDAYVNELTTKKIGDGFYGFSFILPETVVSDSVVVEARLANVGTAVGTPILLSQPPDGATENLKRGTLQWLGGLRFSGTIAGDQELASANVLVDGVLVTRVRASKWSHIGTSEADARAVRAFDFCLPEKFADGRTHQLSLRDDIGEDVADGPLPFLAYEDGLYEVVAAHGLIDQEGLRAQLFDTLRPMSLPFAEYQRWRERFPMLTGPAVALTCAVIFVGHSENDAALESLNDQTHPDWVAAELPPGQNPCVLDATLAQQFLGGDAAQSDFVVFALSGTLLSHDALQRIAIAFSEKADAEVIYGDFDQRTADGSSWPLALPAFDYERMLEQGYCCHLFAMRRATAERLLATGPSNLYRLFNAFLDEGTAAQSAIVHLPGSLASLPQIDRIAASNALVEATREHLERRGVQAEASSRSSGVLPAARIVRARDRLTTAIIIPTRNRHGCLRSCIESIQPAVERSQAEILIVDNDSSDSDTLDYLKEIEDRIATILRAPGDLDLSRLTNSAAEVARAEVLCLLDDDIKAFDDLWLDEMLSRLADPEIAAVGALLVWPNKVVQHGGFVLGPGFSIAPAFSDCIDSDVGYGDLLRVAHECSAVTAACMVTRRRDYLAVGGMDETWFPVNFNDVDYCLKLRATGKRVVFTPHAKLVHLKSASRGSDMRPDHDRRFQRELSTLRSKWGEVLAADPYYNPILSRDPIPYSGLAWPPGPMEPRNNCQPVPRQIPLGF